jgi:ATP-dependent Clp protease ATP-binding subunit ClpC
VLELAREEEPRRFNHNYSGTEHVLLALVDESEGVGGWVVRSFSLGANQVASAIEFIIGRGKEPARTPVAYTPRVYKVLALALDEARQLDHNVVGTGHLLLGLVREGEGIAAGILESHGIGLAELRDATLQALAGGDPALSEQESLPGVDRRIRRRQSPIPVEQGQGEALLRRRTNIPADT